jgi:hypothetical protein
MAPALRFIAGVLAVTASLSDKGVKAFSLTPMRLESPTGTIQIRNSISRVARIELKIYPATTSEAGKSIPSSTPLPDAEVDRLIRLRPSSFRLGVNGVRNVSYKLIDANTSARFFVCAETTQGITRLRHCSRWAPSR